MIIPWKEKEKKKKEDMKNVDLQQHLIIYFTDCWIVVTGWYYHVATDKTLQLVCLFDYFFNLFILDNVNKSFCAHIFVTPQLCIFTMF